MPNDQSHDTRTTDPLQRAVQAVNLEVAYRAGGTTSHAPAPRLRFTDLISGPATGLGDGLGDGAIVTIWGQNIGDSQGDSQVYFTDSASSKRQAAHVYYWKRADGTAPGGPANLYESHFMQEVAFSIPAGSASGEGQITVEVDGTESNALAFTVRSGRILWVAPDGDNANDGTSYNAPKAFVNGDINPGTNRGGFGDSNLQAGDIVYSRGVDEPEFSGGGVTCGMYLRSAEGTADNQIAIVGYPGDTSTISAGMRGVNAYLTSGIVLAKYHISVGFKTDPIDPISAGNTNESNYHLTATKWGRAVGNYMDENPGTVFNGWSGAITSGGDSGSEFAILGNQFYDLGADTTSHYQHTLYMSVRNSNANATAWRAEFNYLKNNKAKYGIHFYDESYADGCGTLTGTLRIRNNVVVNQKGAGINVFARDESSVDGICWSTDIDIVGNVLINCGLGPVAETNLGTSAKAISVGGDIDPKSVLIDSNTIYRFSDAGSRAYDTPIGLSIVFVKANPSITITNNAFYNDFDAAWIASTGIETIDTASNNAFQNTAGTSNAVIPAGFVGSITGDLEQAVTGAKIAIPDTSPLAGAGVSKAQPINLYGITSNNVGAV